MKQHVLLSPDAGARMEEEEEEEEGIVAFSPSVHQLPLSFV
jgi:hypothetical protein